MLSLPASGRLGRLPVLLLGLVLTGGACAQARERGLTANLDTRLSYNVNSRLGGLDGAEWIGEVTPSVSLSSRSGRVIGSLNYGLSLIERSRNEPGSEAVNRLSANFSAEALPRHLYIDGTANIAQQSTSAFGIQSAAGSASANPNRNEVGTATLSPVLRGVLGGAVFAEARLKLAAQNTNNTLQGDNVQTSGSVALSSALPGTLVTWGLSAQVQETDYRVGRTTRNETATATLAWQADADLALTARGGTESQNAQDIDTRRTGSWGVGVSWRPSPRTRLQADVDDRYFGRGYRVSADYRLPRTTFSWASNRDTSASGGTIEPISLFEQFMSVYATDIPDPVAREAAVRELIAALGLDPTTIVRPGFVSSAVSVAERHQFSWAWAGVRLSFGAQAYRSTTTVVDNTVSAFERAPTRLNGYSANVSYRLTPTSSITATGSRQMTKATSFQPSNDLKSATLAWTQQLGRRTNASLSARYSVFNSATDPYREAALQGSLVMRF
jgi:uncharacterized protein (PEP-CTERM system associated)